VIKLRTTFEGHRAIRCGVIEISIFDPMTFTLYFFQCRPPLTPNGVDRTKSTLETT